MADSDKNVAYGISADAIGFEKGMQQAAAAAQTAAGDINNHFKKVGDAFAGVQKQLLVLAGIVAGGAFFKEAIDKSNQLTGETLKLSKMLGITGEAASTLRTALGDIGSTGDDYVTVFTKFGRQLKSNEDGLKSLGLQTRDANGNLRDSSTLFTEALSSVSQYKAGLDQNTYAQTVFGKSIDEVMKLQKLNVQVMDDAKKKNEELGLVMSKDNVAAAKAYKLAMNDVDDMMSAIKKTVGDAVMPVFTELANYFASTGPYVVSGFKAAMLGLLTVFEAVKAAVTLVAQSVFNAFNTIIESSALLGKTIIAFIKGDYEGAMNAGKELGQRLAQGVKSGVQNLADVGGGFVDGVKKNFNSLYGKKEGLDAPTGGTRRMGDFKNSNGGGAEKSRTGEWEAQLSEAKLAYQEQNNLAGTFYQYSKKEELKFWQDKLTLTVKGSAENVSVRRKLADLQIAINTDVYNHEVAALQAQEAAFKQNMAAKLALLDQQAALVKQRFGVESKEYEEVQKKIVESKRHAIEQLKQIDLIRTDAARNAQLAELQLVEQQAQLDVDLRRITNADLIGLHEQFERRRFEIAMAALKEREQIAATDPDLNAVELARIHAQIQEAERQHQASLAQIRNAATKESQKNFISMYDSMQSGFASVIAKTLQGGNTLQGFFRGMWQSVVQAVTGALAQIAAQWLMTTLKNMAISKTMSLANIHTNAMEAGAGAYKAVVGIPYVGPILAPAAAAVAYAGTMAFASAEGGYDIPGTINPITQLHANEMVLPAKHADVIRSMSDNGGGQQGGDMNVTIAAHPMPGNYFMVHRDHLIKALQSAQRDNAWKPA